jgi:hypothetical protein
LTDSSTRSGDDGRKIAAEKRDGEMDVDWSLVNRAKNLVEDQLDLPILKVPIVDDYRQPLKSQRFY